MRGVTNTNFVHDDGVGVETKDQAEPAASEENKLEDCTDPELAKILKSWQEAGFTVTFTSSKATASKMALAAKILGVIPVVKLQEMTETIFQFACRTMQKADGANNMFIGFCGSYLAPPPLFLRLCGRGCGWAFLA